MLVCMPERPTDEELAERLRRSTERLRAANERAESWIRDYDSGQHLDGSVDRLTGRDLPPKRPDLRLIQGGRAEE